MANDGSYPRFHLNVPLGQVKDAMIQALSRTKTDYRSLDLSSLLSRVVSNDDKGALEEFHERRRPFHQRDGRHLRLADYVMALREDHLQKNNRHGAHWDEVIDMAYDLTIQKFSSLPNRGKGYRDASQDNEAPRSKRMVDCRKYFRAWLRKYEQLLASGPLMSGIEKECLAARLLQGFVRRHFELSLKEARRGANPFIARYPWQVGDGQIYVWFPRQFPRRERRAWLENHVEEPDPTRTGEKARIQSIIDENLPRGRFVALGENHGNGTDRSSLDGLLSWSLLYGISEEGLAHVVAREKAAMLDKQRPAIRELGSAKLKDLIHTVFDRLDSEEFCAEQVAERFGLSKATLSRFAGTNWKKHDSGEYRIPDLWINTARVLAKVPGFREAAQAAGVWPRVKKVLGRAGQHAAGRRRDGE